MRILNRYKKELLFKFLSYKCESCNKQKKGKLEIHRINRGYLGGEYILRNIKILCKECHKKYHYKE